MLKEFKCEVCKKTYNFRVSKNRQNSRFCSNICKNQRVGTWVKGNPLGFKWKTATEEEKFKRLKDSFNKLVTRNNIGCWDWKASLRKGYGRLNYQSKDKTIPAHVASWMIYRGKIPKGMCVLHKCDNRSCTNPDHLFLGTNYENVRDMVYKNRQAKGSQCTNSKLNEEKVKEIKKMLQEGRHEKEICKLYNVCEQCIRHIKLNKTWKHVT